MKCEDFHQHVEDALEDTLLPATAEEHRAHAAACAKCAGLLRWHERLRESLSDSDRIAIPAELAAERCREIAATASMTRTLREKLLVAGAAIVVIAVSAAVLLLGIAAVLQEKIDAYTSSYANSAAEQAAEEEPSSAAAGVYAALDAFSQSVRDIASGTVGSVTYMSIALVVSVALLAAAICVLLYDRRKNAKATVDN